LERITRSVDEPDSPRHEGRLKAEPSHITAHFSDVDYSAILRLAIAFDISDADLGRAYVGARDTYAASNAGMDEFVLEMEAVKRPSDPRAGRKAS
jgi:hypothetical protein